jgi:hypothetical protein
MNKLSCPMYRSSVTRQRFVNENKQTSGPSLSNSLITHHVISPVLFPTRSVPKACKRQSGVSLVYIGPLGWGVLSPRDQVMGVVISVYVTSGS